MAGTLEWVALGIALPAAIALLVFYLARRIWAGEVCGRYAAPTAVAVAFCAGCALLGDFSLVPKRHWHWLVYLAPASALINPIALAAGLRLAERWLLFLLAAIVSAWLLVPDWNDLRPSPAVWTVILAGYFVLLAACLDLLGRRFAAPTFLAALTLAGGGTALLIAALVSVTYAGRAAIPTAALAGCWVAAILARKPARACSVSLPYAVVVGGWAFAACIDPRQPVFGLMLAPLAPLALACFLLRPSQRPANPAGEAGSL